MKLLDSICPWMQSLWSVLVATMVALAVTVSGSEGVFVQRIDESSSPTEAEEAAEECLVSAVRRFRVRTGQRTRQVCSRQDVYDNVVNRSDRAGCVRGHRLSNGLLAPLIC